MKGRGLLPNGIKLGGGKLGGTSLPSPGISAPTPAASKQAQDMLKRWSSNPKEQEAFIQEVLSLISTLSRTAAPLQSEPFQRLQVRVCLSPIESVKTVDR